jgi:glycosyltransferase involved in cell wall biosynthesis
MNVVPEQNRRQLISVVVPVYREEKSLPVLISRLEAVAAGLPAYDFEYVWVNDGSPDNSWQVMRTLAASHPRLRVIDLSRNYGKEIALTAGLDFACGGAVIFMDADLQHPPEFIPKLIAAWEEGYEVVATVRGRFESEGMLRKFCSRVFYKIMRWISDLEMVSKTTDFRLIDKKVAHELKRISERQRIFRGLIDWLGFRKTYIAFEAAERIHGEASYSYRKLAGLALNSIIGNSTFPLLVIVYLGGFVSLLSVIVLSVMLFNKFLFENSMGFTNLAFVVVGNVFLTGILLTVLGVMSLYLRKIYEETQGRPIYAVRERSGA